MEAPGQGEPKNQNNGMPELSEIVAGLTLDGLKEILDSNLGFDGLKQGFEPHLHGSKEPLEPPAELRDAAVLIPIIVRQDGLHVILTRRRDNLASHAGQVAFPGGRIDPSDKDPVAAALREAEEEIGLSPLLVDVRGALAPFATGTGFKIFPVVGLVDPSFSPHINESEVAEAFEVPFAYLMNPQNHQQKTGEFRGLVRSYYEMPYAGRRIWGATAHMIVTLYHRLFGAR